MTDGPAATADLPTFRYHPDPVGTGTAVRCDDPCEICGRPAGYRYEGPAAYVEGPFGDEVETMCLRCVADGTASPRLASEDGPATFVDLEGCVPGDVPAAVVDEIAHRTPCFAGWQQERWLFHCGDGGGPPQGGVGGRP